MWPPGADYSPDLTRRYYVMIGAGYGALVNHWMVRATGRVGSLDVLHIGDIDPWRAYEPLPMGQWPPALTLPAVNQRPAGRDTDFLLSSNFAQASEDSWIELGKQYHFYAVRDQVTSIVLQPAGHFEINVAGMTQPVLADKVDVVAGPGPALRLGPPTITDRALLDEYSSSQAPSGLPRVVSGESYLTAGTGVASMGTVCVLGGGPTAAWCVERAESLGNAVVWVVERQINPALTSSRRNDHLAQGTLTRRRLNGVTTLEGDLFPSNPSTSFIEGYVCDRLTPSGAGVQVTLTPSGKTSTPRHVDGTRTVVPLPPPPMDFEQVVVAIGQARLPTDSESWAARLKNVLAPARAANRHFLRDREGRVVGLQTLDGNLRVLGSTALAHPDVATEWRQVNSSSQVFYESLYEQARVDTGIALSSIALAAANQFRAAPHDVNLNAVSDLELENGWMLTGHRPLFPTMAATWFEMRHARIHPFLEDEIKLIASINRDRY